MIPSSRLGLVTGAAMIVALHGCASKYQMDHEDRQREEHARTARANEAEVERAKAGGLQAKRVGPRAAAPAPAYQGYSYESYRGGSPTDDIEPSLARVHPGEEVWVIARGKDDVTDAFADEAPRYPMLRCQAPDQKEEVPLPLEHQ